MMATIYCMHCGAPLDESARFCTECGSPTKLGLRLAEERRAAAAERIAREDADAAHEEAASASEDLHASASEAVEAAPDSVDATDPDLPAAPEELPEKPAVAVMAPVPAAVPQHGLSAQVAAAPRHGQQAGIQGSAPAVHPNPYDTSVNPSGERDRTRRTKVWGLVAAALGLVVILGAAFASGCLGNRTNDVTQVPEDLVATNVADDTSEPAGPSVEVKATLADYSWAELSVIGKAMTDANSREGALEIAQTYHLIDYQGKLTDVTKDVTIINVGTMKMRLVGIWHDDLAHGEGKAGLTFLSDNLLFTHQMKEVDDNVGGWEGSELRNWLNVDVNNWLGSELRTSIVEVDKHTNNAGYAVDPAAVTSTIDKLWVPSVVEVCGPIAWTWDSDAANSDAYNAVLNAEGEQYEFFASSGINQDYGNQALVRQGENGAASWWLRSSSASKSQHYRTVNAYGNPVNWAAATDELGVCLGFCL